MPRWILAIAPVLLLTGSAFGQGYVFQVAYVPDEPGIIYNSKYGWSMAVAGDHVIIGVPHANEESGGVFVYEAAGFVAGNAAPAPMLTELLSPTAQQHFGASVASGGGFIAVSNCSLGGSSYCNADAAWVSIFTLQNGTWQQVQRVLRPVWAQGEFGRAIAMSADRLAVGGAHTSQGGSSREVVYLYGASGGAWGPDSVDSLLGTDHTSGLSDGFGIALSMDGDRSVVGAYRDDEIGTDAGAAYIYERNEGGPENWGLVRKLLASNGVSGDEFGLSVAIKNARCVVGAPSRSVGGSVAGSAYVFERDAGFPGNWGESACLEPSVTQANMGFGNVVALSGQRVAVSAPVHDLTVGEDYYDGSLDIFRPDGSTGWIWSQHIEPLNDGPVSGASRAGQSMAFLGDALLIGTPWAKIIEPSDPPTGGVLAYADPDLGVATVGTGITRVWPQPAKSVVHLLLPNSVNGTVRVMMHDALGARALHITGRASSGLVSVGLADLPAGLYHATVSDGSGRVLARTNVLHE